MAIKRPTPAMTKYLEDLLIDCGMAERSVRNAYLGAETHRPIKYIEDLTFNEAHIIIDELKELRDRKRERNRRTEDDSEEA